MEVTSHTDVCVPHLCWVLQDKRGVYAWWQHQEDIRIKGGASEVKIS